MKKNLLKLFSVICFILIGAMAYAQERTISGVVKGVDGEPVLGAVVLVEGTTLGTSVDVLGNFTINAPQGEVTLNFSYIGMQEQSIVISDRQTHIEVVMQESSESLEEVVVVGYGTQRKSDITGAVASISQSRLEMVPNSNITQALQGALPGVTLSMGSGGASPSNEDTSIIIRGRNSISADNDPLVVVDGIPYSGQLSDISPSDIKSIEVLKDASSAAIYGSRGANGVILITTKGGGTGKASIQYDAYISILDVVKTPNVMNGEEFYEFKMERDPTAMTLSEQAVYDSGEWVDWTDLALRTGVTQEHNISVTGGTEDVKYYVAANYLDVAGIAINDDYTRLSTRINLDAKINDWLTIGTRTALTQADKSGEEADFEDAFYMNPLTVAYNDDGSLKMYPWEEDTYFSNPLEGLLVDNKDISRQVVTNNYLRAEIPQIEGLSYQVNTGVRYKFTESSSYYDENTTSGYTNSGKAVLSRGTYYAYTLENIVDYSRRFDKHSIGFTGVYSFEQEGYQVDGLTATGFPDDVLSYYAMAQAESITPSFSYSNKVLLSQMARINYGYDDRYLFTATVRRDGYSGFGDATKYGIFPSVALGWNIINEDFFSEATDVFSNLKLRLSWGKNGNQAVSAYETISRLSSDDYLYGTSTAAGYIPSKLGEDALGWETTESFNLGVDFGFFNNRLVGDINAYISNTSDLLLSRSISAVHGITSITQNIGKTRNQGIELSLSSTNIMKKDFTWVSSANFAYSKNEIVSLYGEVDENGNEIDDVDNKWFIGSPINVNYGYVFAGVWQESERETAAIYGSEPGFVKILDANNDGTIDENDKQIQGQKDPKFTWGLTNTLTYKDFTLSFFIYGSHGATKVNNLWSDDVYTSVRRNTTIKDWYTDENPSTTWYKNDEDANKMMGFTASTYEDASYIRLKDLTLAYNIPSKIISKWNISKLQVYFTGRNLYTITNWTGIDPEFDDQWGIPLQKEYVFGVSMGF